MAVIEMSRLILRVRCNLFPKTNAAFCDPLPTEHLNMNISRTSLSAIVVSALITLSGCGGGSYSNTVAADSFAAKVNAAYGALATLSGLTSTAVADLFDAKYLDMSLTKTIVLDALKANAVALGTTPELSLFPLAQITSPVISNCDANNVCTLNATLVNSDADTTSVDFSAKVIIVSGVVYFYGDQSSTPSI
jgi:hypothetical protein